MQNGINALLDVKNKLNRAFSPSLSFLFQFLKHEKKTEFATIKDDVTYRKKQIFKLGFEVPLELNVDGIHFIATGSFEPLRRKTTKKQKLMCSSLVIDVI